MEFSAAMLDVILHVTVNVKITVSLRKGIKGKNEYSYKPEQRVD